jgi:hypothetical protein
MLPLPARVIASEGIFRADAHGMMCDEFRTVGRGIRDRRGTVNHKVGGGLSQVSS